MNEKLIPKIKKIVKQFGINYSIELFGEQSLIRESYKDENPIRFMDSYINLIPIESTDEFILYKDDKGNVVFFRNRIFTDYIFFNYKRIWQYFSVIRGMYYDDIHLLLTNWLNEHYPDIVYKTIGQSYKYD